MQQVKTTPILSYSQLNRFNQCPESYRQTYLVEQPEDSIPIDCTYAALGTYIQLLFECCVNNKLLEQSYNTYYLPERHHNQILKELHSIVRCETHSLYQHTSHQEKTPLQLLQYTNKEFSISHKPNTQSGLETKQHKIAQQAFDTFIENLNKLSHLDWGNCQCEVKVSKQTEHFSFIGYVDFYFPKQSLILDGKLNMNLKFATPTQLELYAWGLGINDNFDLQVGLINYTQQQTRMWESYQLTLKAEQTLYNLAKDILECKETSVWQKIPHTRGQIKGYCQYCPIQNTCPKTQTQYSSIDETDDIDFENLSIYKRNKSR